MNKILFYINKNQSLLGIVAVFLLVLYRDGMATAMLAAITLSSMAYLILNCIKGYYLLISKKSIPDWKRKFSWRMAYFLVCILVLLLLPDRLRVYSLGVCFFILLILLAIALYSNLIKNKELGD